MARDQFKTLEQIAQFLSVGNLELARNELGNIDIQVARHKGARNLSLVGKLRVYQRDNFTCCYCGQMLIATPVLRLISFFDPATFPYDLNWDMTRCHRFYYNLTPTLDHVEPISRGGHEEETNLVTACFKCNKMKGEWQLGEVGMKIWRSKSVWNGLTDLIEPVARQLGQLRSGWVQEWLRA